MKFFKKNGIKGKISKEELRISPRKHGELLMKTASRNDMKASLGEFRLF